MFLAPLCSFLSKYTKSDTDAFRTSGVLLDKSLRSLNFKDTCNMALSCGEFSLIRFCYSSALYDIEKEPCCRLLWRVVSWSDDSSTQVNTTEVCEWTFDATRSGTRVHVNTIHKFVNYLCTFAFGKWVQISNYFVFQASRNCRMSHLRIPAHIAEHHSSIVGELTSISC